MFCCVTTYDKKKKLESYTLQDNQRFLKYLSKVKWCNETSYFVKIYSMYHVINRTLWRGQLSWWAMAQKYRIRLKSSASIYIGMKSTTTQDIKRDSNLQVHLLEMSWLRMGNQYSPSSKWLDWRINNFHQSAVLPTSGFGLIRCVSSLYLEYL